MDASLVVEENGEDDGQVPYLHDARHISTLSIKMNATETYLMTVSYVIELSWPFALREMGGVEHETEHVRGT